MALSSRFFSFVSAAKNGNWRIFNSNYGKSGYETAPKNPCLVILSSSACALYQTRIIRTRFKAANLRSYCVKYLDNMFNITCGICLVSTKICRLETAGHPQAMIFSVCFSEASADNIIIFSRENR